MKFRFHALFGACLVALLLGLTPLGAVAQEVEPININTASAELLTELPGIGPSKAAAIIEDRETNGPFESAQDLTRVSGIGDGTVANLEDQITF
ncbi:ComEA family DNA-binding protein [Halomonas icarae]|uniref:ComEA family DNA-binding protein n=1 Tax=Halomonas icarae TaxID=2691040 RepID=A0A7X4VXI9_9GAMM|nr:ComEA family DNA-binding protein [Halomonas icarae]MDR5902187.1 ComEA family DNA-binding protein [Halomonas icarae]NAW11997.1 ComEA family DNA-binding protein [Halomonas icarae]